MSHARTALAVFVAALLGCSGGTGDQGGGDSERGGQDARGQTERERAEVERQRRAERGETGLVTRVIDGDTVELEGVMLGSTPRRAYSLTVERGMCSSSATSSAVSSSSSVLMSNRRLPERAAAWCLSVFAAHRAGVIAVSGLRGLTRTRRQRPMRAR